MRTRLFIFLFAVFIFCLLFLFSCRKDNAFNSDSSVKLTLSAESILFDTVFTTIGSTTKIFYVKNPTADKILISSVYLAGGTASNFSMNVDGTPGAKVDNVEILPNDSIFIFVKVTVDPQNSNSPMVIKDSILFDINGNQQNVKLTAWGQDAHYIVADKVFQGTLKYRIVAAEHENNTWINDKPYLVYGYAVIDSTGQLNIDAGCRIHFFNGSGMWVYKGGSLKVNGSITDPVTFQGSRLESAYSDLPGQWDRIWINEGTLDNVFNYAIIKNGFIGIQAETMAASMGNRLILNNTIIKNMTGIGCLSRFYKIIAANSVFANCGGYAVAITTGGTYDLRHCTIGNYWSIGSRQTPSLVVSNYFEDLSNGVAYTGDLDSAYFGNCIIYGSNTEEILLDSTTDATFNYKFDHCLIRTEANLNTIKFIDCVPNEDPLFRNTSTNDYRLFAGSGAIDVGDISIVYGSTLGLIDDILGNNRTVNPPPDMGAYDYRP
ncbi:MAG: right-handed parallel beta-helix repeat-containing protein [Bacteroidota bacterium]